MFGLSSTLTNMYKLSLAPISTFLTTKSSQASTLSLKKLAECKPVYEELPGWQCDTTSCASFDELPENAKRYVERIEALTGVPVKIVAVGPRRDQTIIRGGLFE